MGMGQAGANESESSCMPHGQPEFLTCGMIPFAVWEAEADLAWNRLLQLQRLLEPVLPVRGRLQL